MNHAVILANGTPPPADTLRHALAGASLFVCADGGANSARALGFTPGAIVGDMDSVTAETLREFAGVPLLRDADPERTDLEKSLDYVLERGPFDGIRILGASAGRLDHVMGHISVLRKYGRRARTWLEDGHGRAFLAAGEALLDEPLGTVVSFFAVGAPAEGVTTHGLRYPLKASRIEMGVQDSVSNVIDGRSASITIGSGELLVFVVTVP